MGRRGSLVIDTKRMNRVLEVNLEEGWVDVEPGILGQHLEDRLEPHGVMTAHSPSSIMCSTVGGYVAARSAGQFSSRYGVFEDMLLGVEAATPSGLVQGGCWTRPGAEDLQPLICGSEGALGVVTRARIRLARLPQDRVFRAFAFPGLEQAWDAMRGLMQAGLWPSVLRLYDPVDTRIGGPARKASKVESRGWTSEHFARFQRSVSSIPAMRRHMLDLPLALPRLVNRIAEGLGREVLLVVGFEGDKEALPQVLDQAAPFFQDARDLGAAPGEYWYAHRHDVSYKMAPIFIGGGWADTMEVATTWSRLEALHTKVRAAISRHALVMAHFSHAYPEGCSIYFSFIGSGGLETYDATWRDGLAAAREAGGTVTHHHGVGILKSAAATQEAGAAIRIWRDFSARLDPGGIMNPGRLFPEGDSKAEGPPPPEPGVIKSIDSVSRLALVDPLAPPELLDRALGGAGYEMLHRPTGPIGSWLGRIEKWKLGRHDHVLFSVQARFEDGQSVRLGPAPRSAAGPDLRWPLLRRAQLEQVEIPITPQGSKGIFGSPWNPDGEP
jgi:alkyldihydroxyacetonephosphate synthase